MEIYKIYFDLLENPFAVKNYRKLEEYYREIGLIKEADTFKEIIDDHHSNFNKES